MTRWQIRSQRSTNTLVGTVTTCGNLTEILRQCHESHPAIWLATKPPAWLPKPKYVVFIPGNRTYGQEATRIDTNTEAFREVEAPMQPSMSKVSSTMVRRLFFCHESQKDFANCLKTLVINPDSLASFLGMKV